MNSTTQLTNEELKQLHKQVDELIKNEFDGIDYLALFGEQIKTHDNCIKLLFIALHILGQLQKDGEFDDVVDEVRQKNIVAKHLLQQLYMVNNAHIDNMNCVGSA